MGQGAGLQNYTWGQTGGSSAVTVLQSEMPSHTHTFNATTANATAAAIGSSVVPAVPTVANASAYAVNAVEGKTVAAQLAVNVCGTAGNNQPHSNLMPSLCITFCIALQGIFPSRN